MGALPPPPRPGLKGWSPGPSKYNIFSYDANTRQRGPCWSPTPAADAWVKGLVPRTWRAPRPAARCPGLCPTPHWQRVQVLPPEAGAQKHL